MIDDRGGGRRGRLALLRRVAGESHPALPLPHAPRRRHAGTPLAARTARLAHVRLLAGCRSGRSIPTPPSRRRRWWSSSACPSTKWCAVLADNAELRDKLAALQKPSAEFLRVRHRRRGTARCLVPQAAGFRSGEKVPAAVLCLWRAARPDGARRVAGPARIVALDARAAGLSGRQRRQSRHERSPRTSLAQDRASADRHPGAAGPGGRRACAAAALAVRRSRAASASGAGAAAAA